MLSYTIIDAMQAAMLSELPSEDQQQHNRATRADQTRLSQRFLTEA